MKRYGLTTKDNPYDVFDDYISWMNYDHQKGYFTSELLARIAKTSDELSDEENQREIENAIDTIIFLHPLLDDGEENSIEYIKIVKDD